MHLAAYNELTIKRGKHYTKLQRKKCRVHYSNVYLDIRSLQKKQWRENRWTCTRVEVEENADLKTS